MTKAPQLDSIEDALTALGVTEHSLTTVEKHDLTNHGYAVLNGVLSSTELSELQRLFDAQVAAQIPGGGPQKETGTRHLKDLHRVEKLWRMCLHPRVLAAVYHILKRRFFSAVPHGREPLEGFGQQGLHIDWSSPGHGDVFYVATAICLLDDFTLENGATRVVPGSHRNTELPNKKTADPGFVHSKQIVVTAKAGSVLLFNGHLLHSGTRSRSRLRRRTLQCTYAAHDVRMAYTNQATFKPADLAARYIFGSDSEEN